MTGQGGGAYSMLLCWLINVNSNYTYLKKQCYVRSMCSHFLMYYNNKLKQFNVNFFMLSKKQYNVSAIDN